MLFLKKNIFLTSLFLLFFSYSSLAQISTTTVHQFYCPLSESEIRIVENFSITDPTNTLIPFLYIQITSGYITGEDLLSLRNPSSHPNITVDSFNSSEGKLTLHWVGSGTTNYTDLISAVESVVFQSSNPNVSGTRTFSITLDNISYLALTDHYYEYLPDIGIHWTDAKDLAEDKFYWGRQGYLATITSYEEAVLVGKQAPGTGWIGGSDEAVEGTWRWMTGPETGKSFWIGEGNGTTNGTDIPFANWNPITVPAEPNNAGNNEHYAHIVSPNLVNERPTRAISGSWNDLSNTGASSGNYQPKGYIVEYGKPGDPHLSTSASTKISISRINFSKSVRCPTRVFSTRYFTLRTGEYMASIGTKPMG